MSFIFCETPLEPFKKLLFNMFHYKPTPLSLNVIYNGYWNILLIVLFLNIGIQIFYNIQSENVPIVTGKILSSPNVKNSSFRKGK